MVLLGEAFRAFALESYARGLRRHRRSRKAVQDLSGFAKKRKKKTAGK